MRRASARARVLTACALAGCAAAGAPSPPVDSAHPVDTGADACALLTWQTVGAPVTRTWCAPCHARDLGPTERQDAPDGVNLETEDDLVRWADQVVEQLTGDPPLMPPAGGPTAVERARLLDWLACAAR